MERGYLQLALAVLVCFSLLRVGESRHPRHSWRFPDCHNDRAVFRWLCPRLQVRVDYDFGIRHWWEGDNVCVKTVEKNETVNEEEDQFSTRSVSSGEFHRTEIIVVKNGTKFSNKTTRACCHGYERKIIGYCKPVKNMKDILSTMADIGSSEAAEAMNITGLTNDIKHGNFTVFAPTDDALSDFLEAEQGVLVPSENVIIVDGYMSDMVTSITRDTLKAHVIAGYYPSFELEEMATVETLLPGVSIHLTSTHTFWGKKVLLANCAEVVKKNRQATNGVVHQVDKVLRPADKTVSQFIARNPEFSEMKTLVGRFGLNNLLPGDGPFTLFLPSNAAFEKLDPEIRKSDKRLAILLRHHVVSGVLCSACVGSTSREAKSAAGDSLVLTRKQDDKLFVEDAQVTSADVIAKDGVIHVIDELLVPASAKSFLRILSERSRTVNEMANTSDFTNVFRNLENFTMFLPTDKALQRYFRHHDIDPTDKMAIRDLLQRHTVSPMITLDDLEDVTNLQTLDPQKTIRVRKGGFGFTEKWWLQCKVPVTHRMKIENVFGGNIIFIAGVLPEADHSLVEKIHSHHQLTTFNSLLEMSSMQETLSGEGLYTVLAPTNSAFDKLRSTFLTHLFTNDAALEKFIKQHVIADDICVNDYTVLETMAGSRVRLGQFYRRSNSLATNGNLVVISDVIADKEAFSGWNFGSFNRAIWKNLFNPE